MRTGRAGVQGKLAQKLFQRLGIPEGRCQGLVCQEPATPEHQCCVTPIREACDDDDDFE